MDLSSIEQSARHCSLNEHFEPTLLDEIRPSTPRAFVAPRRQSGVSADSFSAGKTRPQHLDAWTGNVAGPRGVLSLSVGCQYWFVQSASRHLGGGEAVLTGI